MSELEQHGKHVQMMHFVMAAGQMVKMDWRQTLRVTEILIEQIGDKPIAQVTLDELLNALSAWERETGLIISQPRPAA